MNEVLSMIIRSEEDKFICIEQHHHAQLSRQIIEHWKAHVLNGDPFADDVLYAIEQHDVGWDRFDRQPLWNDKTNEPYTFIDLPLLIKTVLYTYGINLVEERNPYAAALCSAHYAHFLKKYEMKEVQQFVKKEALRRKRILNSFPEIDELTFRKHLSLLQFADNLSLFICLHEPGNNEKRHRYFEKGIPLGKPLEKPESDYIDAHWVDGQTLTLKKLPKVKPFSVLVKEKHIDKTTIAEKGWLKSYEETPYEERKIDVS